MQKATILLVHNDFAKVNIDKESQANIEHILDRARVNKNPIIHLTRESGPYVRDLGLPVPSLEEPQEDPAQVVDSTPVDPYYHVFNVCMGESLNDWPVPEEKPPVKPTVQLETLITRGLSQGLGDINLKEVLDHFNPRSIIILGAIRSIMMSYSATELRDFTRVQETCLVLDASVEVDERDIEKFQKDRKIRVLCASDCIKEYLSPKCEINSDI